MADAEVTVVWTEGARGDLYAITAPLHDVSPWRAEALLVKMSEAVQRLALFPETGVLPFHCRQIAS